MNITPKAEGIFYPKTSKALLQLFNSYEQNCSYKKSKLIIVPHAGYEFSGELSYKTYLKLNKNIQKIIIIAPAIHNKIYGKVTAEHSFVKTPIGNVEIQPYNTDINNKILETESSLCVQFPIIKHLFPNAVVIPIVYGCEDYNNITEIIKKEFAENAIVIVSNLSRFIPAREALRLDNLLCEKINKQQTEDLDIELADGALGICAALKFAKENNYKFIPAGHNISSDVNADTSSVVGYGGWYLSIR